MGYRLASRWLRPTALGRAGRRVGAVGLQCMRVSEACQWSGHHEGVGQRRFGKK